MVRALSFGSIAVAILAGLAKLFGDVAAQEFPSQPIRIIVATPAGGIADLVGRTFAQRLSEGGKTAVVENRTGASGALAAEAVARAAPDGHTLFVSMHQTNAILPHLTKKLSYDPLKDFAPILNATASTNILIVHPSLPARTVPELVAYAKANPGKLTYASQGNGSSGHVVGEQFKLLAGVDIGHVPYRGAAPASQDLVAGHVSMMFDILPLARTQMQAGTVRALAVAAPQRLAAVPDVPSMAESGFPQIEGGPWFGLAAPAGTPRAVIDWLNAEGRKAFSAPDVRERFLSQGILLPLGTPEDYGAFIESEYKRWGDIIRSVNIRLD
ncbi:MAG: Bug family tripartite tricarboxylate transporter substrate binding protein [Xanthobacteraceae bacterium]